VGLEQGGIAGYRVFMTSDADIPPGEGLEGVPRAGDVIGGKFVVEEVLGVGGMGVVVSARHAQLGQKVAIKLLRKDAAKSPEAANRFLREARAVVALQSAHVVRVMDVGVLESGTPYMVMEHLVGTDLQRVLEERRTLPVSDAVDFLLQGMEAIAEAHAAGIVHRDLKPANLFLASHPDGSPLVKVLDFGISKASGSGSSEQSLTATATIMGSPLYMSPEQLRSSKNVDARTDVWALGVILYELLAGKPPFEAENVTGLCAKIAADPPAPLREIDPSVPPELEAVVMRCLEKNVDRRFASVADLANALRPFASMEGKTHIERIARIGGVSSGNLSQAKPIVVAPSSGAVANTGGQTDTAWQTSSKPARSKAVYVVAGVGALIALALGVGAAIRLTRESSPPVAVQAAPPPPASVPSVPVALAPVASSDVTPAASASASPSVVSAPAKPTPAAGRPAPRPAPAAPAQPQDLLLDRK
jgi:serine/threonine-protein kinase